MKKIIIVFGTRPEAIKLFPLIKELKRYKDIFKTIVCVTSQHKEMLHQMLDIFHIEPEYDLDVMSHAQELTYLTNRILEKISKVFSLEKPDYLIVQGDTTTAFVASLAAFYNKLRIAHVEAGLRTFNKYFPFPEEINRVLISHLANLHFAPTKIAKHNLIKEGIDPSTIEVTGNTVIDTLLWVNNNLDKFYKNIIKNLSEIDLERKIILITGHRRENFGKKFLQILEALKIIAQNNKDIEIVYPVHLNPSVNKPAYELLKNIPNIKLIKPLDYISFIFLLKKCYFIISDSGGIQEEAAHLGKPILITRDVTERPEILKTGMAILVGTEREKIINTAEYLLNNKVYYNSIAKKNNIFGDGKASKRIVKRLIQEI